MIATFSVCRRGSGFWFGLGQDDSFDAFLRMAPTAIVHRLVVLPAADHPTSVSLNHLVCEYGLKDEPAAGRQRRESLALTRTFALVADPFATGTAHDSGSA